MKLVIEKSSKRKQSWALYQANSSSLWHLLAANSGTGLDVPKAQGKGKHLVASGRPDLIVSPSISSESFSNLVDQPVTGSRAFVFSRSKRRFQGPKVDAIIRCLGRPPVHQNKWNGQARSSRILFTQEHVIHQGDGMSIIFKEERVRTKTTSTSGVCRVPIISVGFVIGFLLGPDHNPPNMRNTVRMFCCAGLVQPCGQWGCGRLT